VAAFAAAILACLCAQGAFAQSAPKGAQETAEQGDDDQGEAPAAKRAAKKKQNVADAQRAIEAAAKLLQAGKTEEAVQNLTAVLAGGKLPPALMAKALYYRGIAYRKQDKPAQAISDLTSALWLKGGLSDADRADAMENRAAAYRQAGLPDQAGGKVGSVAVRSSTGSSGWSTGTTTAPAASLASDTQSSSASSASSGGLSGFWASLFGGPASSSMGSAEPNNEQVGSDREGERDRAERRRAASGWSRNTEVRPSEPEAAPRPIVTAAVPGRAAAAKPEGKFRVQVAIVRTREEAVAVAGKLKQEHGAALGMREPQIDETVVGNMGSFYRVRVGPYATQQEAQALCARLKGSGLDCFAVTN
jgi:tetratricopeptide (TPR) repeat protein